MKIFEKLRNISFWTLDNLKRDAVRANYEDIKSIIENQQEINIKQKKEEYLNNLLRHAVRTTKFYSSLTMNLLFEDFPVIDKNSIRNRFNDFLSSEYEKKDLIPVVTSGSTGTPFKVYHDKRKKYRNYADTLYFAGLAGYQLGHHLIYMKIWAKQKMKNSFHYWLQNIQPVDVLHLNNDQMSVIIKKLETSNSTFGFLGYASAMEELCKYLDNTQKGKKVDTDVRSIISMSESLNDYTKRKMSQYFGTPTVSRYSNLENGIIAQQLPDSEGQYLVNTASYILEILQLNSDEPVNPGETGRIVITDLFNYAMPMIRYDTGDLGAFSTDPVQPGKVFLSTVEGRKLDQLYDTKGNHISSYIMYKNMWQYSEISQYQLIQTGKKEYVFKINAKGNFTREDQLRKEFISYLGDDATFKIKYVDEIPLLASGKRKKVVNEYITNKK
jgi:phenylacetate-CoA ligase